MLLQRRIDKGSHFGEEEDLSVLGNNMSLVVLQQIMLAAFNVGDRKFQKNGCYIIAKVTKERQQGWGTGRPDCSREWAKINAEMIALPVNKE